MTVDDLYLTGANWQHRRTGAVYRIEGFATREEDMVTLVIYRKNIQGGATEPLWSRPASEFFDGRFVRMFPGLRPMNEEQPS